MLGIYQSKFRLENGRLVFVPSDFGRDAGVTILKAIHRRWRRPSYFYHLRKGGHIAALKHHLADDTFAMIDITGFFDSITRAKLLRALRSIGYRYEEAMDIARQSTVEKTRMARDFSLPYGFIQSPVLASLALDRSALGRKMSEIAKSNHTRLTSYMDDIILSGVDTEAVESSRLALLGAAAQSGFSANPSKSQPTSQSVKVFNIVLSHDSLALADERLEKFADAVVQGSLPAVSAILAYVSKVNRQQTHYLAQIGTNAIDPEVQVLARHILAE